MPNEERVDSVIVEESIKRELAFLNDGLDSSLAKLKEFASVRISLEGATNVRDLAKANVEFVKSQQAVKTQLDSVKVSQDALNRSRQIEIQLENEQLKNKALKDAASKREITANTTNQKVTADLTNEYKLLGKAVKESEQRYYNLALTQGRNSAIAKEALAESTALKNVQIELNRDTRIYTDNVGNYASAFTGYANTLRGLRGPTKLLGEALGIGAQEADQFRIVIEHSLQGIAAYFRAKEEGASHSTALASAMEAETGAQLLQNEALEVHTEEMLTNNAAQLDYLATMQLVEEDRLASIASVEAETAAIQQEAIIIDELVLATAGLITEKEALILAEAEVAAAFEAEAVAQGEQSAAAIANIVTTDAQITANNILAASTIGATAAQKAFKVALIGTGIGAAIALIAGLVYAIYQYTESVKEANHQRKILSELQSNAAEDAGKELGALKESKAIIEDVNISMKTRLANIKNVKDEFPSYFAALKDEKILTGDVADAYDKAAEAIIRKAKAEAASAKIAELSGKQLAIDLKAAQDSQETADLLAKQKDQSGVSFGGGTGGGGGGANETKEQAQQKVLAFFKQREVAREKEKNDLQKDLDFYINYIKAGADETVKGDKTKKESAEKSGQQTLQELVKNLDFQFAAYKRQQLRVIKSYEDQANGIKESGRLTELTYDERIKALQNYTNAVKELNDKQAAEDIKTKKEESARSIQHLEEEKKNKADELKIVNDNLKAATTQSEKDNLQGKATGISAQIDRLSTNQAIIAKNTAKEIANIKADARDKDLTAEKEFETKFNAISKESYDAQTKLIGAENKKQIDLLTKSHATKTARNSEDTANELTELQQQYAAGLISTDDYEKKKQKIQVDSHIKQLKEDLQFAQNTLLILEQQGVDVTAQLQKIADLKIQLTGAIDQQNSALAKNVTDFIDKIKNYYEQIRTVIEGALDASATARKNQIQDEIDAIDARTAKELAANDAVVQSAEQKAANIAIINNRAQFQKDQLAKKQKEIDRKDAEAKKALAIFEIILNTARAIGNDIAKGGPSKIFNIAFDSVMGAAQLAVAIATPIPQFRYGTDNAPAGLAVVSEDGPELMIDRNKKMSLTPPSESLIKLKGGERIIPSNITQDILNLIGFQQSMALRSSLGSGVSETESLNQEIQKKILGKLGEIKDKTGIIIHNHMPIETTAYYLNNMKR